MDPGVPGALGGVGRFLGGQVDPGRIDRIWIFPPVRKGRREHGLLVAALRRPDDPLRLELVTVGYQAEETGKGITLAPRFREEGAAPPDRLLRVMEGVVRRSGMEGGHPEEIPVRGDPSQFEEWLAGLDVAGPPEHQEGV